MYALCTPAFADKAWPEAPLLAKIEAKLKECPLQNCEALYCTAS